MSNSSIWYRLPQFPDEAPPLQPTATALPEDEDVWNTRRQLQCVAMHLLRQALKKSSWKGSERPALDGIVLHSDQFIPTRHLCEPILARIIGAPAEHATAVWHWHKSIWNGPTSDNGWVVSVEEGNGSRYLRLSFNLKPLAYGRSKVSVKDVRSFLNLQVKYLIQSKDAYPVLRVSTIRRSEDRPYTMVGSVDMYNEVTLSGSSFPHCKLQRNPEDSTLIPWNAVSYSRFPLVGPKDENISAIGSVAGSGSTRETCPVEETNTKVPGRPAPLTTGTDIQDATSAELQRLPP